MTDTIDYVNYQVSVKISFSSLKSRVNFVIPLVITSRQTALSANGYKFMEETLRQKTSKSALGNKMTETGLP